MMDVDDTTGVRTSALTCQRPRAAVAWFAAVLLLAGCGGDERRTRDAVPEGATPQPTGTSAPDACALLGGGRPSGGGTGSSLRTCTRGPVRLTVDTAAQAPRRFSNSLDETAQVANQGSFRRPVVVEGVGDAAYWAPATNQLKVLDGDRILVLGAPRLETAKQVAHGVLARGRG